VLVIGSGEISTLTAQHLRSHGVGDIAITSRTAANAQALADAVGGRAVPWTERMTALASADIVLTATGAQRPILTRDQVDRVRKRGNPLFIIDVAVPRDVEPSVGDIEQVFLYNVDDLQSVIERKHVASRRGDRPRRNDRRRRGRAVHGLAAVSGRGSDHRRSPSAFRCGSTLGAESTRRKAHRPATRGARARRRGHRLIVEKLLIEPTEQLKALPDEETQVAYTEALNRLFRLREEESRVEDEESAERARRE
jgi:glutamyl-tRNA reductase